MCISKIKYYTFVLMQLLRKILFPVSLLYALVVYIRNWLFDFQLLTSKSYKTPILCVGNLSAGGTGKTPMVETIISLFKEDCAVAVLSRGYGRKSKGYIVANSNSSVEELGDEPFQIWSKFPSISMVVDADRRRGIQNIEKDIKPNFIILDDGFQHRKVKPGFLVLLTAYDNLYTKDWYLPTGNLRDSKKEAKRANLIIVTKCPENISVKTQKKIEKALDIGAHQNVLFSFIGYKNILDKDSKITPLKSLQPIKVTLVTGIANAAPLESYLHKNGITFEHLKYKDHHFFTEEEIQLIQSKKCVLTTEKDFVRLKDRVSNLKYISIEHTFFRDGKQILEQELRSFIFKT